MAVAGVGVRVQGLYLRPMEGAQKLVCRIVTRRQYKACAKKSYINWIEKKTSRDSALLGRINTQVAFIYLQLIKHRTTCCDRKPGSVPGFKTVCLAAGLDGSRGFSVPQRAPTHTGLFNTAMASPTSSHPNVTSWRHTWRHNVIRDARTAPIWCQHTYPCQVTACKNTVWQISAPEEGYKINTEPQTG